MKRKSNNSTECNVDLKFQHNKENPVPSPRTPQNMTLTFHLTKTSWFYIFIQPPLSPLFFQWNHPRFRRSRDGKSLCRVHYRLRPEIRSTWCCGSRTMPASHFTGKKTLLSFLFRWIQTGFCWLGQVERGYFGTECWGFLSTMISGFYCWFESIQTEYLCDTESNFQLGFR